MREEKSVYGIIGYPVEHSLSPLMHNAAFEALGLDAVYKLFPLQEQDIPEFFKALKEDSSSIFGLNVTVPHKEKVVPYIDNVSPFAQKAMAVNTIVVNHERKLIGYNTDGPGFLTHLAELGFNFAGKNIVILGAGGSTRAIIAALCLMAERPESIKIYNRTTAKAIELVDDLSSRINLGIVEVVLNPEDLDLPYTDLLINTTSVGLKSTDPLLINVKQLHSKMLVYDLIYNPQKTRLLQAAEEKGAQVANGLGMLFYQGILSFQHWANILLDQKTKEIMRRALESGLKK